MKLDGKCVGECWGEELEGGNGGGYEQDTLYICMSNNKTLF